MRVLVGTLVSGENEFERCCESVRGQTFSNIEHRVIEGLATREAHRMLFREFMERTDEFDFMLKVDADMVLARPTLVDELAALFANRPELRHYQVAVQDWYTDRLILGMNAYRNTIRWSFDESIFVENSKLLRFRINGSEAELPRTARIHDRTELAPAAWHSPDPHPGQAFHFGLHKGVKVVESQTMGWLSRLRQHATNIEKTFEHYRRCGDTRLLRAALGGELAVDRALPTTYASNGPEVEALYSEYQNMDEPSLKRAVIELRAKRKADRRSLFTYCQIQRLGWIPYLVHTYLPW